jgi:hypothetical protein
MGMRIQSSGMGVNTEAQSICYRINISFRLP